LASGYKVSQLTAVVADLKDTRVPALARSVLQSLVDQLRDTERRVEELDARLAEQAREDEVCQRLMTIPGIGPVAATALAATVGDATVFGRDVIWRRGSAWCRPSTRAAARSVRAASPKRG
jgi:transposase